MFFPGALKYLNYKLFSRHRRGYGIHSPFVFDLVTRVFRNKTDRNIVFKAESLRRKSVSDRRTLNVLDLGAGSARMKTNKRKVSDIAKFSSVPSKYGMLLSNMAAEFGKPDIVELGTSLGISTIYMASGAPGSAVYTMEGCPETSHLAISNFSAAGLSNIRMMQGSFDVLVPELKRRHVKPGLIFIDGNHRKEPLLRYFSELTAVSCPETVIIIDDIHSSCEMEEAWSEIKKSENATFTIDIFRMGMVFFRKGVSHIDYIIRY